MSVMVSTNLYATDVYIRCRKRIYTSVAYRLGETLTYIYVGYSLRVKSINFVLHFIMIAVVYIHVIICTLMYSFDMIWNCV